MYNYVFFASNADYLEVAYSDIFSFSNVYYQKEFLYHPTLLTKTMFMIHYSSKINSIVKLPFKKLWYSKHFSKKHFHNDNKYIFTFFYNWNRVFDSGYIEFLKKHFTGCKCVLFLQDINNANKLNIEKEKNRFDHVMVFEKNFAKKHNIEYYPLVYSEGLKDVYFEQRPFDLTFIGRAKGRYDLIKAINKRIRDEGLKGCFYLSGIDKPDGDDISDGINFVKYISYEDTIRILKQSKCILDIVPNNKNCNTLRSNEAIIYGTKLLTNNPYITEEPYYDPKYISIYSTPNDIDIKFLKNWSSIPRYKNSESISPISLLNHLNKLFQ